MNPNKSPFVSSSLIITAFLLFATFDFGVCRVEKGMIRSQKLGGVRDITEQGLNGIEIETLARFAVEEHNKKEVLFHDLYEPSAFLFCSRCQYPVIYDRILYLHACFFTKFTHVSFLTFCD